jgi:nucleotide-binding universal stress UspA family protein
MLTRETVSVQAQTTQIKSLHIFKRILVPLDGSTCAEEALPVAAHLAHASGATIMLVRVVPATVRYDMYPLNLACVEEEVRQQSIHNAKSYLQHITANEVLDGIGTRTELLYGNSVDTLIDYAKEQQADLIVLCSHGNIGVKRWILGSVAQQMLRQSPIPMLIVRQGSSSFFIEKLSEHRPFKMLVTLDGSILAETALLPAAWLSATLSTPLPGQLHLLRVVQSVYQIDAYAGDIVQQMNEQAIQQAEIYLTRMEQLINQSELVPFHLNVTSAVAFETDVAHTLVNAAEHGEMMGNKHVSGGYDAIALATHGRQGLPRWVAGSVAEQLLGGTHVPLLVVSHPQA